jgi:mono/diheme cytochrome c family protein
LKIQKAFLVTALSLGLAGIAAAASPDAKPDVLKRGEYLLRIGGCNDCHTAGYGEKGGVVPTAAWLTGVPVGYQGPWGTTYAANLRLTINAITEEQWLQQARLPRLPPMPFWALKDMTDADLRAVYQFVRSLGSAGTKMPAAVAPGGPVTTPVIVMVPQASH